MTRVTAGGTDAPSAADDLEAQALAEVRGYERTMEARAKAAFPDKTDPIRIYGEGLAVGGVAFLGSLAKLTRATEMRLRGLFQDAERAAEAKRAAAEAQRKADATAAEADRARTKREAQEAVRAGFKEIVAVERQTRYLRAFGLAVPAAALMFGLGMAAEHWRGSAAATRDAANNLAELQRVAGEASLAFAQSARDMQDAVGAAGSGLAVLRAVGNLPPAEMEAAQAIIGELGSADGRRRTTAIAAVRDAMSIPPERRRDAVEFARIEDPATRANFIEMAKMADARRGAWWTGETPYAGCLVNGPVLPTNRGAPQPTCLVALPLGWQVKSDANLRNFYRAQ